MPELQLVTPFCLYVCMYIDVAATLLHLVGHLVGQCPVFTVSCHEMKSYLKNPQNVLGASMIKQQNRSVATRFAWTNACKGKAFHESFKQVCIVGYC